AASPMAFTAMKLAGAAYLAYLAWQALRDPGTAAQSERPPALSRGALYRRGIIMNLTNPKVLLFFFAFLPQFVAPAHGPVGLQIVVLGAVFMLATLLVFGAIAFFSGAFGQLLQRSPTASRWLNRLAGMVFLGLAVRLATASREPLLERWPQTRASRRPPARNCSVRRKRHESAVPVLPRHLALEIQRMQVGERLAHGEGQLVQVELALEQHRHDVGRGLGRGRGLQHHAQPIRMML